MTSKFLISVVFGLVISCNTKTDTEILFKGDYRLFHNTPIKELALAVREKDTTQVRMLSVRFAKEINTKEPKFGQTLLMVTVANQDKESCRILLQAGADPNIHDTYNGTSAIIEAAGVPNDSSESIEILKLLLAHGSDPNDLEVGPRRNGYSQRNFPLLKASGKSLNRVKILLSAGADINFKNEFNESALGRAIVLDRLDIVNYLLENGANYEMVTSNIEGKDYYLWNEQRYKTYFLDTKEYDLKMNIVKFLETKGINYNDLPVPEFAIKQAKKMYPSTWKEYLKKY